MNKALDSLHTKILKSKFAEEVTETEIEALVKAKNNGWILCSELLPEEGTTVLLCANNGLIRTGARHVSFEHNRYNLDGVIITCWDDEVIAWQPMPDKYEEKGD